MRIATGSWITCLALSGAACDGDVQAPPSAGSTPSAKSAESEAPTKSARIVGTPVEGAEGNAAVKAGSGAEDRFTLTVEPSADAAVGKAGIVKIKVLPQAPWHVNLDYPTSLKLEPTSGITLAKSELKKEDATALNEDTCAFDVAYTPSEAGEKSVKGLLKFAVCQDDACSPVQKDIEFKVAVK